MDFGDLAFYVAICSIVAFSAIMMMRDKNT